MTMPETAIDKNDRFVLGQHDIRLTGEIADMQAKSEAMRMKVPANKQFRLCILTTDTAHIVAANLG